MMKKLMILSMVALSWSLSATEIKVESVQLNRSNATVDFTLSWKNGWKNNKNHDAAWLFVKLVNPGNGYTHGTLAAQGHRVRSSASGSPSASLVLPQDRVGVFVEPSNAHRGSVSWQISLKLHSSAMQGLSSGTEVKVYAIEMVYIPQGGYTLGDPDPKALGFASFFKSDGNGNPDGLYEIASEKQTIPIGTSAGNLYYNTPRPQYQGDKKGTVPATFPKGVNPFYIMKYETTQGLYVDFLNTISPELAAMLSPHEVQDYYKKRGSIKPANGKYIAESPARPINYITWDDGASMADWAGLRPMTELEFTKAARGPSKPLAHEFPWNTNNTNGLIRKVTLDDELTLVDGVKESDLTEQNRHIYGASYYWVMDLAGSLWEKCVTIGDEIGRNYLGTHGDGTLSEDGKATNADWPKGINEIGGYGYRGGGYYNHGMRVSEFNPHSPIAYRPYGAWAGGKRSIAYSQRYVRTAPQR